MTSRTRVRGPALGADGERIAVRAAEAAEQSPPEADHAACTGLRMLAKWLVRQHAEKGGQHAAPLGPEAGSGRPGHSLNHRALTPAPPHALMCGDE